MLLFTDPRKPILPSNFPFNDSQHFQQNRKLKLQVESPNEFIISHSSGLFPSLSHSTLFILVNNKMLIKLSRKQKWGKPFFFFFFILRFSNNLNVFLSVVFNHDIIFHDHVKLQKTLSAGPFLIKKLIFSPFIKHCKECCLLSLNSHLMTYSKVVHSL